MSILLGLFMLFQPLVVDNFHRANGSFASSWVAQTGYAANFIVSSNTATVSNLAIDSAYNNQSITWPNDQWASVVLLSPGSSGSGDGFGIIVRASASAETFYSFSCDAGGSKIYRAVTGTYTALSTNPTTCASGDTITLGARGTTITAYKNWVSVFSVTDSAIASGNPGIFYFSTDSGGAVSQWWAGTYQ